MSRSSSSSWSATATPRKPTTPSPTARFRPTTARSAASSAPTPTRPSASSASGNWRCCGIWPPTGDARSWPQACERSAPALATNPRDLPFALIYLVEPDGRSALPPHDGDRSRSSAVAPVSRSTARPVAVGGGAYDHKLRVVSQLTSRLGPAFRAALAQAPTARSSCRSWRAATGPAGFLVVGLNPFRLFDDNYSGFMNLVASQIAAAIANADAYEEERRRAEALAELDRAKTAFFSNVSHEFRTPLTLMLGPIEDALDDAGGRRSAPASASALAVGRAPQRLRLLKLVNSLLDFSRIEAGRVAGRCSSRPTSLQLTADLAASFRSAIEKAGLHLDDRLAARCPSRSIVDRDMWEKIVLNLLSNAFKFTFDGGIAVDVAAEGGCAVAERQATPVRAFRSRALPRLFERFHRVEGRARPHASRAPASALRWCRNWSSCTAARSSVESTGRQGHAPSPYGCRSVARTCRRTASRRAAARRRSTRDARPERSCSEALRWLPDGDAAESLGRPGRSDCQTGLPDRERRARVLLADDNADMREYVAPAAGHRLRWSAVAPTARRRWQQPARRARPGPDRRHDAEARRLRAAAGRCAATTDLSDVPVIMLSARAGEEAKVEGLQCRRRRLSGQAVLAPASCWRASPPTSSCRERARSARGSCARKRRASSS